MSFRPPWTASEPAGDRFRGDVAATYLAEREDHPMWHGENAAMLNFLKQIPADSRVLDVPFGTGRFVPMYRERGYKVSGIEISDDMLAVAREQLGEDYDQMDIRQGDALALPYADKSFDAVVCIRFLESIIPWKLVAPCLREFRRVCSGTLIARLNSRYENDPPNGPPGPEDRMMCWFSLDEVAAFAKTCGWQLIDSEIVYTDKLGERRVCVLRAI
jgi:SAM-dependent methyltransferase